MTLNSLTGVFHGTLNDPNFSTPSVNCTGILAQSDKTKKQFKHPAISVEAKAHIASDSEAHQ